MSENTKGQSLPEILRHGFYVVKDYENRYSVITKKEYEEYIIGAVMVGGGSAYKLIIGFNGNEDYLYPKEEQGHRDEAIGFVEWVNENYAMVESIELKKSAWVNFKENEVLIHGSDYHFTTLINECGKTTEELFTIYKQQSK